jgi:hypothetical protein
MPLFGPVNTAEPLNVPLPVAPVNRPEGDTWQFNVFRKGQIGTSTDQIEGMYEVSVTQGSREAVRDRWR